MKSNGPVKVRSTTVKFASQMVNDGQLPRQPDQLPCHPVNVGQVLINPVRADQMQCHPVNVGQLMRHVDQSYPNTWLHKSLLSGAIRCCHVVLPFALCYCLVNSHVIGDQLPCHPASQQPSSPRNRRHHYQRRLPENAGNFP